MGDRNELIGLNSHSIRKKKIDDDPIMNQKIRSANCYLFDQVTFLNSPDQYQSCLSVYIYITIEIGLILIVHY